MSPDSMVRVQWARLAVAVVFFVNGAVFATWATRVPAITSALRMSPAALAAVVFGLSAGALVGLPLAGLLVSRFGSARIIRVALVVYTAALAGVPLAPRLGLLAVALVGLGVGNGLLDVAMNTAAMRVEQRHDRQIMAGFYALFSLGGVAGALAGAAAAAVGVSARTHLTTGALLLLCAGLLASAGVLPDWGGRVPVDEKPRNRALCRDRRLVVLGLLACCSLLCEGVANDWSAVYIRDTLGGGPGIAAAGFALFSLTMTGGRLIADRLVARVGPVVFLRVAGLFAGTCFGLTLFGLSPVAGLVGFGVLGLGLAGVVPTLFSAAARGRDRPAPAISTVSTIGYLGFLAGPPLVGAVATLSGLRVALGAIVVLALAIAAGAGALRDGPG